MNEPQEEADAIVLAALASELAETPYVPLQFLARGGMGALLEVEHKNLKRPLVMKILRERGRPDLEDRLRVEAHALARLSHPNVLGIVDFNRTPKGRSYLVAERLRGHTLRDHLVMHGALPVAEACDLASQALRGLSAAHALGIVHRDVKLENLFVCPGNGGRATLKVLDFGIAKIIETEPGRELAVAPPIVPTEEGSIMGTPSFMSPEQVLSHKVDHRADVYGMGVVLYRLLTGHHPFVCASALEYARAHATETPTPPSTHVPLPAGLDAVVLRALAKKPADRYQTADEMIEALAPFATPREGMAERPVAPSPAAKTRVSEASPAGARMIDPPSEDSLPTNPIRRSSAKPAPITSEPAFAPAPPPPPPRPSAPSSPASLGVHGTIIVSKNLLQQDPQEAGTRFVPSLDPTPPMRRSARPNPPSTALSPATNRDGPTRMSRRRPTASPKDRGMWLATLLLVAIVVAAGVYVAYLVRGSL